MRHAKAQRLSEMEPRLARQRMREIENALPALQLARSTLHALNVPDASLIGTIKSLTDELTVLRKRAGLPISPRDRPKLFPRDPTKIPRRNIYLDESGTRDPKPQIGFPLLVLTAVAFEPSHYWEVLQPAAVKIKKEYFPEREGVYFHEPQMRKAKGKFAFNGDVARQRAFYADYTTFINDAEFMCAAVVLNKQELLELYNIGRADRYLPQDAYAIAYDLLLETTCHMLHYECDDARGSVYPEATQATLDAALQAEHARIFLRGTRSVSGSWFQHQMRTGLHFFKKRECLGIEIADSVSRTVAEHAMDWGEDVPLWKQIEPKLYCADRLTAKWGSYRLYPSNEE